MTRLEELSSRMEELAPFVIPSKNYDRCKALEYYTVQDLYQEEKSRINVELSNKPKQESSKIFVNGYGEATHREITSSTYKRAQNRTNKDVLNFLK